MPARIVVRPGEPINHALDRLRRKVCEGRAANKWPVWKGHYAKPSEKRHRKRWLRAMKEKWRRVWERHRKQPAGQRRS